MWAGNPDPGREPGVSPRPRLGSTPSEHGLSLIEIVVAMAVLGTIMSGLALSMSVDYKAIALARTRQVAEAAANKRLEEFRDVDYATLALASQPSASADPADPDSFLSQSGAQYDVTGTGQIEDLIVATGTGPVVHLEQNVTIGDTVMDVYRYVTWVDIAGVPGTHDAKRLTVVVRFSATAPGGTARLLRESVLLTPGTVSVGASIVTTTTSTTTTTMPPTTTTTIPATTCGTFTVAGASPATTGFTATTAVTITMSLGSCGSNVLVSFSNDGGRTWGPDFAYSSSRRTTAWTLANGDGTKTVSGRLRNGAAGSPKLLTARTITLDTTRPTTPASFTRTATCSGSNRTVVLTWSTAGDANLVGYRVYRSVNGAASTLLSTITTTTTSNRYAKAALVSYYLTAYDRAGNVSNATATITLTQNQCS